MSNGKPRPSTSTLKSPLDEAERQVLSSSYEICLMNSLCFASRRRALAALAFGLAALAGAPAIAQGDIYVHAGANFKPVTIAVTPFAGEEAGDKISGVIAVGFRPLDLPSPAQPGKLSRDDRQS